MARTSTFERLESVASQPISNIANDPVGARQNSMIAEDVFRAHQPALLSYLRRRLNGDQQTAADVAQEAFARIVAAKRSYARDEARGLLYAIARNLCIDHLRGQRTRARAAAAFIDITPDHDSRTPERLLAAREELALIEQAILMLPPRCQQVYVLHRFEGMSYAAIAAHCGITASVVEKHIAKALKRLAAAIEPPAGQGAAS